MHSHVCINNPVQVLLVGLIAWASTASTGSAEQFRLPVFFSANFCSLFALSVFDKGLFVRGYVLVSLLDGVGDLVPEFLGLAVALFGKGARLNWRGPGVGCVEEEVLLASLSKWC